MLELANKVFSVILGAQGQHAFFLILTLIGIGLLMRSDMV